MLYAVTLAEAGNQLRIGRMSEGDVHQMVTGLLETDYGHDLVIHVDVETTPGPCLHDECTDNCDGVEHTRICQRCGAVSFEVCPEAGTFQSSCGPWSS